MKKIFVGRILINFLWTCSIFVALISFFGALFIQIDMLYLLFLSAFFFLFSLLCFINNIEVSEEEIKINCIINKQNYPKKKLKQIYIRHDIFGFYLILNFKKIYEIDHCYEFEYVKLCKIYKNKSTCSLSCNTKELRVLLKDFKGSIVLDKRRRVSLKKKLISLGLTEKCFD